MPESVGDIMRGFASRTGLASDAKSSRRYLWTDAFAVCNELGLFVQEGDEQALGRALQLVDATHRVLGRHRPDDPRSGWISGLDEETGRLHPTLGGLRIGKDLPERGEHEPYDASLEWDRDGQYFHYLTRWMHALGCVYRVTRETRYLVWALELAETACARFAISDGGGGPRGLYWKMSIDLARPQVPSMGQHDALDGWITCCRLRADARQAGRAGQGLPHLDDEIRALSAMCAGRRFATDDALGLGGLLTDAHAVARLVATGNFDQPDLIVALLGAARGGISKLALSGSLDLPAEARLAFREFGLSIGLHALDRLRRSCLEGSSALARVGGLMALLDDLEAVRSLGTRIEEFWSDPQHRQASTWLAHREINEVMWATTLAPGGYLDL